MRTAPTSGGSRTVACPTDKATPLQRRLDAVSVPTPNPYDPRAHSPPSGVHTRRMWPAWTQERPATLELVLPDLRDDAQHRFRIVDELTPGHAIDRPTQQMSAVLLLTIATK